MAGLVSRNAGKSAIHLDFHTGKLFQVVDHVRPRQRIEYGWLAAVLGATLIPYVAIVVWHPLVGLGLILLLCVFKVVATFLDSARTDVAHHIRFLLLGSNPIGMTGGASLLLGAVDAILDWKEDAFERKRTPVRYWIATVFKFVATPLGAVLMSAEFAWDLLLLWRGTRLPWLKCQELFSLAQWHDLVCPEKSNDLFYADMAFARYRNDAYLYQWNRMRALVFELEHYRLDVMQGQGVPATNLLRQDEITAYQTLKRLRVEEIEDALEAHYEQGLAGFPVPPKLADRLVKNARPIEHYLRCREQLHRAAEIAESTTDNDRHSKQDGALRQLIYCRSAPAGPAEMGEGHGYVTWHLLRLLDADTETFSVGLSRYLTLDRYQRMVRLGILEPCDSQQSAFRLTEAFKGEFEAHVSRFFERQSSGADSSPLLERLPGLLSYRGQLLRVIHPGP